VAIKIASYTFWPTQMVKGFGLLISVCAITITHCPPLCPNASPCANVYPRRSQAQSQARYPEPERICLASSSSAFHHFSRNHPHRRRR